MFILNSTRFIRMIFTVSVFILFGIFHGQCISWKENSIDSSMLSEPETEFERTECTDQREDFCKYRSDIDTLSNSATGHFLKKKASAYGFTGIPRNTKIFPVFQSYRQCACACKMDYPLMDLGRKYFPRFIQTGVCKADSCGSHHKCVEKKYKVAVIKQKDVSDQDLPEIRGLPSSLRDAWISETVSVSIACECVPKM